MGYEFYKKEFYRRIKKLREYRKIAHPNELPLIDDTLNTMIDMIGKDSIKNIDLTSLMADDYKFLQKYRYLWDSVRKFAKMPATEIYEDFVSDSTIEASKDDLFDLTHNFFKNGTDKKTYQLFLDMYKRRNRNVSIFQDKGIDFMADSIYLPYYRDVIIQLNKHDSFEDVSSLVHEYGHGIQSLINYHPNLYQTIFQEIVSIFFELISFEYYSKDKSLNAAATSAQWDDFISRVLFADDLADEFALVKRLQSSNNKSVKAMIAKNVKRNTSYVQGFIDYNTSDSFKYVIGELIAIELYMIYRKDQEKAMYLLYKIIDIDLRLPDEEYLKEIQKIGIQMNSKTSEYQDHLIKRMRTISKRVQ